MIEKYQEKIKSQVFFQTSSRPGYSCIGLLDKNSKQIFSGDEIEWYQGPEDSFPIYGVILFGMVTMQEAGNYGKGQFEYFGFYVEPTGDDEGNQEIRIELTNAMIRGECEVIGNIFVDY
jgi:hypothetical protein